MTISTFTSMGRIFALLFLLPISQLSAQDEPDPKAVPVFDDGMAQRVDGFTSSSHWIRHDLWVETDFDSDGDGKPDRMHVDVTRPSQTETSGLKLPVIYESSPYYAGVAGDEEGVFWNVRHEIGATPPKRVNPEVQRRGERPIISQSHVNQFLPLGFVVVHSSSPGTGLSDGVPTIQGENESLAPKSVVEWLCGKRKGYDSRTGGEEVKAFWSTGKVGMLGTSYNGTLALAAALTGVEGLECILPVAPNTSPYHYYRSNGLVRSPGGYLGEDIDVLYDYVHSGDEAKRARNNATVRDKEMAEGLDRITGDYNDFWASRDYLPQAKNIKAPMFMAHGFNDWNVMPEHSLRIYEAVKNNGVPTKIYYHQSGHGGLPPKNMVNRWFTHYLHGVKNDIEKGDRAWIVREGDSRATPTAYADYPNPKAESVTVYPGKGAPSRGSLSTTQPGDQGTETLTDNFSFSGNALAKAEYTAHRLIYVTPELTEDLHLSGKARITVRLASSKPAVNLSVWLVSLPWNEGRRTMITDNIITRGWADPQNRESLRESTPLEPGKFYDVSFDLQPDDQVIKAGQQIGLMIFSSDREFTLWPDPGTELTIDLDHTSLTLPVVGGDRAFGRAVPAGN